MIFTLINLGLVIIPFFFLQGYDTRVPKLMLATGIALALGLWGLYSGSIKGIKNKWVLVFILYSLCQMAFLQKIDIQLFGIDVAYFWTWKYLFLLIVFALMYGVITNLPYPKVCFTRILRVMTWVGTLMAMYVILQQFHIDQFFAQVEGVTDTQPQIGGTMGHSTLVSSFIAMLIPIAIMIKHKFKAVIMGIAVCISLSQIAIGAVIAGLLVYLMTKGKKYFWTIFILVCVFLAIVSFYAASNMENSVQARGWVQDNARFNRWSMILNDVLSPSKDGFRYPITGFGPGSFEFMFHTQHGNGYHQAHSEFMEVLYNHGFAGIFIFLAMIFSVIRTAIKQKKWGLLSSFVIIVLCAAGTFTMHLGAHMFYIIVIAGLIQNKFVTEQGGIV